MTGHISHATSHRKAHQIGAVAIEFALLIVIFIAVLYGIMSYSFVFLLQQALTNAAAEGARAAVRVDPLRFTTDSTYEAAANRLAMDASSATLQWLPPTFRARLTVVPSWTITNQLLDTGAGSINVESRTVAVVVTYPNYATQAFMPVIQLPGIGTIPNVPTDLVGRATVTATGRIVNP